MAGIDRRPNAASHAGGSSILDTGLDATDAEAAFGAGTDPHWSTIGELEGGDMGENIQETEFRNEAGELVLVVVNENEETFDIGQSSLSTDDETLALLGLLADGKYRKFRYPLPAGVDAQGNRLYQLWCFPNARVVRENWRMGIQNNQVRKRPFKVRAYKVGADPLYVVATVRLDDQTGWPAELDGFKDTVFAAA